MVLVGSLLPDIIDKPLRLWLAPEVVNFNARSVGDSLSFNVVLLAVSLVLLSLTRFRGPLVLALASAGLLLFDQMWRWPERLLWPLYGWAFPRGTTTLDEWLSFQFSGAWLGPQEVLGAAILAWFALHPYRHRVVLQFLKVGALARH